MEIGNFSENVFFAVDDSLKKKNDVLEYIAALAAKQTATAANSKDDILAALQQREKIGSTGYENGVALPHCSLDTAEDFVTGVLVVPSGVDFQAIDGQKSYIFAYIIGPTSQRNSHVRLLSAFSRIFSEKEAVQQIAAATDESLLRQSFSEYGRKIDDSHYLEAKNSRNLVLMVLQNKEYFEDFLGIFAATIDIAVTIVESNNAGNFFHRMPLFASFWSEPQTSFNKVIMAVVDRDKSNDLVRRLSARLKDYNEPKGILIAVQELAYTMGSLEF